MSMKNSSDTIGNRTRDLPACRAVPQRTAPPRATRKDCYVFKYGSGACRLWITLTSVLLRSLQGTQVPWRDRRTSDYATSFSFLIPSNPLLTNHPTICVISNYWQHFGGRGSSVSIATRYRLNGPGIEHRWKWYFPHPSGPALGPTRPPVQWVPGLLYRCKVTGALCWPPTPFIVPRLKKQSNFNLSTPSGPSWPSIGWH